MAAHLISCLTCGQVHPTNVACPPLAPFAYLPYPPIVPYQPIYPQGYQIPGYPYPYYGICPYPGQMPYLPQPMVSWHIPMTPPMALGTQNVSQAPAPAAASQNPAAQTATGLGDIERMVTEAVEESTQQQPPTQTPALVQESTLEPVQSVQAPVTDEPSRVNLTEISARIEAFEAELAALRASLAAMNKAPMTQTTSTVSEATSSASLKRADPASDGLSVSARKPLPPSKRIPDPIPVIDGSTARSALIKSMLGPILPLIHINQTAMNIVEEFGDIETRKREAFAGSEDMVQRPDPTDDSASLCRQGKTRHSGYPSLQIKCKRCGLNHPTDTCGELFQVCSFVHDRNTSGDDRQYDLWPCDICIRANDPESAQTHTETSHGKKQWYEHPDNVDLVKLLKTAAEPGEVMLIVTHYIPWPSQQRKVPMPLYCYFPKVLPKPDWMLNALEKPLAPALRDRAQTVLDAIARLRAFSQEREPQTSATRALEEYLKLEDSEPPQPRKFVVSGRNQKSRWGDAHWCVPKKKSGR